MGRKLSAFLRGFGSAVDISGTSFDLDLTHRARANAGKPRWMQDRDALASDWRAVGNDMRIAMDKLAEAHGIAGKNVNGAGLTIEDFRRISDAYGEYINATLRRK